MFAPLVEAALAEVDRSDVAKEAVRIADSMPIMMAKEKRSSQAKVAPEFADKGYCSSKGVFFYGVKLHVVGGRQRGSVPLPECIGLTPGSENDLVALRCVLPTLEGGELYGDKAYSDGPMKERLCEEQDLDVLTPVKKKKGRSISQPLTSCSRKRSAACASPSNPSSTGLTRRLASNAPQRCAHTAACWFTSSGGSPLPCYCSPLTLNWH